MGLNEQQIQRSTSSMLEILVAVKQMHHGNAQAVRYLLETSDTDPVDLATAGVIIAEMALAYDEDEVEEAVFDLRIDQLRTAALRIGQEGKEDA